MTTMQAVTDSLLDLSPIWRGIVTSLQCSWGIGGPFAEIHDAMAIERWTKTLKISERAIMAKLETHVHLDWTIH